MERAELTGFGHHGGDELRFRAQQVDSLTAGLMLTNGVLHATNLCCIVPRQCDLEALGFDVGTKRLYLTNAVGRLNPVAVTTAIGREPPGI